MIFRVRPIRSESPRQSRSPWGDEGEVSRNGEAALGPLPGSENASKRDMRVPGEGGQHSGLKSAGLEPTTRSGPGEGTGKEPAPGENGLSPTESANSTPGIVQKPQPSSGDGVPEDMATLVLDKSALGQGQVVRPDPDTERLVVERHFAAADPASDAAIMLKVAAGDESGFNYLVE